MKTAQEFLQKDEYQLVSTNSNILMAMRDYAQYCVEQALFHASEKVMLSPELHDFIEDSWESGDKIDKKSILEAFPKDNIKMY